MKNCYFYCYVIIKKYFPALYHNKNNKAFPVFVFVWSVYTGNALYLI